MRWSNSSLFTMQQCGERFRRKYIENDRRPSGIRAKRGVAVHKVANVSHMRQLEAKQAGKPREEYMRPSLPSDEEARDLAATMFDWSVREHGVMWTEDEKEAGIEKVAGAEKDAAIKMASHYNGVTAPRVDPVAVERRVVIKPTGSDVEIVGTYDLVSTEPVLDLTEGEIITEDAEPPSDITTKRVIRGARVELPEIEVVNDLKTAQRAPQDDAAAKSQQLSLYALIRGAETGKPPKKVRLRVLTQTRTGKVSEHELTADRTEDDLNAVAQRLNAAIEAARVGSFVPANPDSWWCSQSYCEYWGDCKFALGRKR